tara:strand:+ start:6163 stop:6522 length:360 start_codon:yes stop_codon:yes gene_type:complete
MIKEINARFSEEAWQEQLQLVLEAVDGELHIIKYYTDGEVRVTNVTDEGTLQMAFDVHDNGAGSGKEKTYHLTLEDLLKAYWSLDDRKHCGSCDYLSDPDAHTPVTLVQQAIYGERVYA